MSVPEDLIDFIMEPTDVEDIKSEYAALKEFKKITKEQRKHLKRQLQDAKELLHQLDMKKAPRKHAGKN
jgi:hypothetical protein